MAVALPVLDVLDAITIPTHCPVPWDGMRGDDRTRHCAACDERVHDVSMLTTAEAVALLNRPGQPPCLRIYRRRDGRVMTADCPAGRRERTWRWVRRRSAWAAAAFAFLFQFGCKTALQGLLVPEDSPLLSANSPESRPKTADPPVVSPP
ncbi:MAG TPA: hypothetical protein VH092_28210 [Urbifossiella sp.]|jgi:hypothetical protein|nr:hypothetical protein [Urbifossiella sp.]